MQYSNWDYIYAVFMLIFGIFMIISPRSLMRKAKYDEESLKTESWVKKAGIGLCIMAPLFAFFIYYKIHA
ncbi:MAG: hypothetical protein ACK5KN_11810 [Dysgonomonas sp.]|jgi:hypothetical protein|uniref:hypothetical protein n=1 Tax=Dysgonomonas sp. TaxID=1891233 RepID=UPI0028206B79|nr:hypothetical protein [Prevotella sp.]